MMGFRVVSKQVISSVPLVFGFLTYSPAHALEGNSVFTGSESNMQLLCRTQGNQRVVDRLALTQLILDKQGVPIRLLDKANPQHISDGNVTRSDLFFAVTADAPFGENLSATDKRIQDELAFSVRTLSSHLANENAKSQGYELIGGSPEEFTLQQYLTEQIDVEILCLEDPVKPLPERQAEATIFDSIPRGLVLRGEVKDLTIARPSPGDISSNSPQLRKFAAASQFTLSFSSDRETDSQSVETSGTIGYSFPVQGPGAIGLEGFIPFIHFKNVANDPDPDIGYVQPGVLAFGFIESLGTGTFAAAWNASASGTFDYETDSEVYQLSLEIQPDFRLSQSGFATGQFNRIPSANVRLRPEVGLIASGQYIADEGTNPELVDADSFFSLGARVGFTVQPETGKQLWDNMNFAANYLYLSNSNGREDVRRFEASLTYLLPRTKAFGLELKYVNGRDRQTLIDEDRIEAGFGLKF